MIQTNGISISLESIIGDWKMIGQNSTTLASTKHSDIVAKSEEKLLNISRELYMIYLCMCICVYSVLSCKGNSFVSFSGPIMWNTPEDNL